MGGEVVPLYSWVTPEAPEGGYVVTIEMTDAGPALGHSGRPPAPDELITLGRALVDAGRAARNGDDPAEVIRLEWERRRRPRRPKPC